MALRMLALYVVIHTATRVVRRAANQPTPTGVDETLVQLSDQADINSVYAPDGSITYWVFEDDKRVPATKEQIDALSYGPVKNPDGTLTYWKLDDTNQKVAATQDEVSAAQVDPATEATKRQIIVDVYQQSIEAVIADGSLPKNLNAYFVALRDWLA